MGTTYQEDYDFNPSSPAHIQDEIYNKSTGVAFYLGDAPRNFKTGTNFKIYTASGGGGTQLVEDTDYTLSSINKKLSNAAGYEVKNRITLINYGSTDLYYDYYCVASEVGAARTNDLQDQIDDNAADIATNTADIATNTAAISALQASNYSGVVNTVHIGKRTSSLPDFLTYSGQYVGIDTNSGSDVLRLNVANSRDNNGLQATIINILADVAADGTAWTIPTTDGFYQLFIKEDATYYVGTLDMEYVAGTVYPTSPSTGDLFFDINDNQMYRYTGSAWTADPMVPVGEAVVSSSVISSVICYAFNGRTNVDVTSISNNSLNVVTHNLGHKMVRGETYYIMQRTQSPYVTGDYAYIGFGAQGTNNGNSYGCMNMLRNSIEWINRNGFEWFDTGASRNESAQAPHDMKFIINRGF